MRGIACAGLAWWVAAAAAAGAHHSILPYDNTRPTTVTGTVTRLVWQNPHTYVYLDVRARDGLERWVVESEGESVLERLGWRKEALAVGDRVTVTGGRTRSGETRMRCRTIEAADGTLLPCFPS